jgi:hypothetical protein
MRSFVLLLAALFTMVGKASSDGLPAGAILLDPDMVSDMRDQGSIAVSPDDKLIAYISKGAIWVCNVTSGPPTRLAEVPNTATARMNTPEFRAARIDFNNPTSKANIGQFHRENSIDWVEFPIIEWARSQEGVYYFTRTQLTDRPWTETFEICFVSLSGNISHITTVVCDAYDKIRNFKSFHVTKNWKYVVASVAQIPLIWEVASNKPRVTPFDYLVPSSTSDHFLGIEIDTRQLVTTDEKFEITQRFDVTVPQDRFLDLIWSPDEQFVVCRLHINGQDGNPDSWEGFRFNLQTGEKTDLTGAYLRERVAFTGHGGELVRTGTTPIHMYEYADGGNGTYIAIVPDGSGDQHDVFRFVRPQKAIDDWQMRKSYPPVRWSSDASLFAVAQPRGGDQPGFRYLLIDRNTQRWPLGPDDGAHYISPYYIIAIANDGKTIVGCDDTNLFSIPVESIQKARESTK